MKFPQAPKGLRIVSQAQTNDQDVIDYKEKLREKRKKERAAKEEKAIAEAGKSPFAIQLADFKISA